MGYDASSWSFGMSGWSNDPAAYVKRFDAEKNARQYATNTDQVAWPEAMGDMAEALGETERGSSRGLLYQRRPQARRRGRCLQQPQRWRRGNDPFIISVRSAEDYAKGHLPGAVWASPKDLFTAEMLAKLPTDRPIVAYCYTGQTAGQVTAGLNMLGYDAASMTYGMSGWSDDPEVYVKRFDPEDRRPRLCLRHGRAGQPGRRQDGRRQRCGWQCRAGRRGCLLQRRPEDHRG